MEWNESQKQHLARFGSTPFTDLPPEERLQLANLANVPDMVKEESEPEPAFTQAQRDYLGKRAPADLTDPGDRENFARLGGNAFQPKGAEQPKATTQVFELDIKRLTGTGLSPSMRMDVGESFRQAQIGLDERRRGVHESARTVKDDQLERALQYCRPYLAS